MDTTFTWFGIKSMSIGKDKKIIHYYYKTDINSQITNMGPKYT